MILKTSKKGFDFKGKPLTEETLNGRMIVLYRSRLYITGNRYKNKVELFGLTTMDLKYIATMKSISLTRQQNKERK